VLRGDRKYTQHTIECTLNHTINIHGPTVPLFLGPGGIEGSGRYAKTPVMDGAEGIAGKAEACVCVCVCVCACVCMRVCMRVCMIRMNSWDKKSTRSSSGTTPTLRGPQGHYVEQNDTQ